jgi:predicted AAA+ superfamily ATPase
MKEILKSLVKINFWEKNPNFNLGFIREGYNSSIWNSFDNKLIKVIIGQRRTGKSFIVRQLMHKLVFVEKVNRKNIFYLNKELFEFENIRNAEDLSEIINLYELSYKPKGKIYLFVDEVQNINNWEKIIASLAQHPVKDYEIVITGSNSKLLSGELATLLSGRYILTEVFPFSYKEYLEIKELTNNKENFIRYISSSGLPEIFNLSANDTIVHYFQSLKNTILLKDIMHRHKIRDYVLLEDIFLFLLHNVGNLTSIPSILKYFKSKNRKVDYTTISQHISYMQEAFIIHEAPRKSVKTKELLSGEKKYFINDLGFRNYLYPNLINDISAILENVVYTHLRMSGNHIYLVAGGNYEVDFFAEKEREKQYVQVCYVMATEETRDREFGALEKINDNLSKYIVSMDDLIISKDNGIIHKHIWDFVYELT